MKKQLISAVLSGAALALAAVETAPVFTDNMILQRDTPIRVWGTGKAGENVEVTFGGSSVKGTVGRDGRWKLELPAAKASAEGTLLTVKGDFGTQMFGNVLVGDIWLCAGQSNMQWQLKSITGAAAVVSAANNPLIRLYRVPCVWSRTPMETLDASWTLCTPETAAGFSAVGYLTGAAIQKEINVPVGLISIAWGGCRVESMTALESMKKIPALAKTVESVESQLADMNKKKDDELRKDKQRLPVALYNAMVRPLGPFAVKGMLWYQGEDNHSEGAIYAEKLKALADTWRSNFANPEMPIYIVQLPPYKYGNEDGNRIPNFWAAQQRFAETDKNAGFIVSTDCGEENDIHPRNKIPLAQRLANLVLFRTYGIGDDAALAPTFRSATRDGGRFIVEFDHANGLATRDGKPVSHLMLAGEDNLFHPATATIENDRLVVTSERVREPRRLRFGWDKLANPNLVNSKGVPAAPFDTAVKVK
ncbi:MAG: hypothetical protein HPZ91_17165 [Lentisphaeria bacterium]|nr:hypothetical protein [Lentisphaeria bacterium]